MLLSALSDFPTFIFIVVALVIAITVHECSHALMALWMGDSTAKLSGRLTLNPLSHLDPVGSVVLLVAGFGWGRPVPYNPHFVRHGVWGETAIALAGPISNILLAALFALPGRIYFWQTGQQVPAENLWQFLAVVVSFNLLLAAFNLLPIPPLDGSKLLYLIVDRLTFGGVDWWLNFERLGPMLLLILLFVERLFNLNIFWRVLEPMIALLGYLVAGTTFHSIF